MSLNWEWKDKCGTLEAECENIRGEKVNYTFTLYRGNAMLIVLDEQEDKYSLVSFFADDYHLKNLLGLNKKQGYTENHISGWGWKKMTINTKKYNCQKYLLKMIDLLLQGVPELKIELYQE